MASEDVAREAVERAGAYLRERFDAGVVDGVFDGGDVKTVADREAERRIIDTLRDAYPDHAIAAEESGHHPGREDRRWVVDALDGTNNFAAGIPTFGAAATLLDTRGPLATAVAVPVTGETYVARRGEGVRYDGDPVTAADGLDLPPDSATVAAVIGTPVLESPARMDTYEAMLADLAAPKRVIETWAPVVYWGLLARGRLGGFVCFHPDEREQAAGELLAREAGCIERSAGPLSVFGRDERTVETVWAALAGPDDERP